MAHWTASSAPPPSNCHAACGELDQPDGAVEAMGKYAPYFRGFKPVPAADVALAYAKSVEGLQTGQTIHVG
jgi:hypothetical protein